MNYILNFEALEESFYTKEKFPKLNFRPLEKLDFNPLCIV